MSLTQALQSSAAGLRATQAGLALISSNVANAETPGYVRKTLSQVTIAGSGSGASVRTASVDRALDEYVQRQLRVESAGGAYADQRANFYDRLQLLFGQPGADGTLEATFNQFTAAVQALTTSPETYSTRTNVLNTGRVLAQQLNSMSNDVQALRQDAELGLSDSVNTANEAMRQISNINQKLAASPVKDMAASVLMDQRDRYIDQLAELMDIRVLPSADGQVNVFTNSGVQLVGTNAAVLKFDPQGTMTPATQWSADPAERGVGTITLVSPNGDGIDLLANNSIRSGKIAAYVEMRDHTLVEAQAQLDAIAAALSQAMSDRTTAGTPATSGAFSGFDVDVSGMLAGNTVQFTWSNTATGEPRTITLVRVDDPAALPLSNDATADPNDIVVGLNFSGGMASIVGQLSAAMGPNFAISNPSGNTLRILEATANVSMDAMSVTKTASGLTGGSAELPLFMDGVTPYSGAITSNGNQLLGLAQRLVVNAGLLADPSKLITYSTAPPTSAGDNTRPDFILSQLMHATMTFPPQTGLGSQSTLYRASLPTALRQVLSQQGEAAAAASSLKQGQAVVVNALQQRANDASAVNIDDEMSHLLQLQAAYGANARVLSAVKEMLDLLMRM